MTPHRRRGRVGPRLLAVGVAVAALIVGAAGCTSSDDDAGPTATDTDQGTERTTTTGSRSAPLEILVSNDDGYGADGIDALVNALDEKGYEVTVVAPKANQSGQGGTTTTGELETGEATTKSGYPVTWVDGRPADAVNVAFDDLKVKPDVVVTGINQGQNVGPLVDLSGTVGAARAGARRGVPALAVSSGVTTFDYDAAVPFVLDWLSEREDKLKAGSLKATVGNLNVPSCSTGEVKDLVDVPSGADEPIPDALGAQNCAAPDTGRPADDVKGFLAGYAVIATVPNEPETPAKAAPPPS